MHIFRNFFLLCFLAAAPCGFADDYEFDGYEEDCYAPFNSPYYPFYAAIEEGYMTFNTPKTISGVLLIAATEETDYFNELVSEDRTDSNYTKLTMGVLLPWFAIEGSAFYYDDQQRSNFSAITTVSSAFFFQGINGIDQTPFGLLPGATIAGAISNQFIYWGLGFEIEPDCAFYYCSFEFFPFLDFDYSKISQNYNTVFGLTNAVGTSHISNALEETIQTSYYDLGLGIKFDGFIPGREKTRPFRAEMNRALKSEEHLAFRYIA